MTPEHKPKILQNAGLGLLYADLQAGWQPKDRLLSQAGVMAGAVLDVH